MGLRKVIAVTTVTKQTRDESAGRTPVVGASPDGSLEQLLSCVLHFTVMTTPKVVWGCDKRLSLR